MLLLQVAFNLIWPYCVLTLPAYSHMILCYVFKVLVLDVFGLHVIVLLFAFVYAAMAVVIPAQSNFTSLSWANLC